MADLQKQLGEVSALLHSSRQPFPAERFKEHVGYFSDGGETPRVNGSVRRAQRAAESKQEI